MGIGHLELLMKTEYIANNLLKNDRNGTRFEIGDTVKDGDFPKKVIKHWLQTGELIPKKSDPEDE